MRTRDMNDEERMAMMATYVPRLKDIGRYWPIFGVSRTCP